MSIARGSVALLAVTVVFVGATVVTVCSRLRTDAVRSRIGYRTSSRS
jgi:hypothetical protein